MRRDHIPEFDTLRTFAALGVMVAHYGPLKGIPVLGHVGHSLGALGVDLFFALSGFLITGILVRARKHSEHQSVTATLKRFYARRALRIFPLYYLVILIFFVLQPGIRQNIAWFLLYAVNIGKSVSPHDWTPLNHFWSLAVEEQFYICWPLIVLLTRTRAIVTIAAVSMMGGMILRAVIASADPNAVAVTQFTLCCLEPLALGSAFAVVDFKRLRVASMIMGAIGTIAMLLSPQQVQEVFSRTVYAIFSAGLVATVAVNSGAAYLKLLRLKPLMYLGKISYGLYVWHLPVDWALGSGAAKALMQSWMPPGSFRVLNFTVKTAVTIVVAMVSWHLFEGPINEQKKRWPYRVTKITKGQPFDEL